MVKLDIELLTCLLSFFRPGNASISEMFNAIFTIVMHLCHML